MRDKIIGRITACAVGAILVFEAVGSAAASSHDRWQLDRSIDCAALAYIATSAFEPDSIEGIEITKRSAFYREIMSAHLHAATAGTPTNGDVSRALSARLQLLNSMWSQDRAEVVAVNRLCWSWGMGLGYHMAERNAQMSSKADLHSLLLLPIEQTQISLSEADLADADLLLEITFEIWRSRGSVTSETILETLERVPLDR